MSHPWAQERVQLLRKLWADGLTALQISQRFGCTKSSIHGKLTRLGLIEKKEKRLKRATPRPRQQSIDPTKLPRSKFNSGPSRVPASALAVMRPVKRPPVTEDQKEYILGQGTPLLDLAPGRCLWAINERKGFEEHLFCGAEGDPYCPHHMRMAYYGRGTPSQGGFYKRSGATEAA